MSITPVTQIVIEGDRRGIEGDFLYEKISATTEHTAGRACSKGSANGERKLWETGERCLGFFLKGEIPFYNTTDSQYDDDWSKDGEPCKTWEGEPCTFKGLVDSGVALVKNVTLLAPETATGLWVIATTGNEAVCVAKETVTTTADQYCLLEFMPYGRTTIA